MLILGLRCEDVDDALCCKKLPNGNVELSVHIADVSYFVTPGMATDLEARNRSTTVYLADRRYDMLPEVCHCLTIFHPLWAGFECKPVLSVG